MQRLMTTNPLADKLLERSVSVGSAVTEEDVSVFVVDDDPAVRESAQWLLGSIGLSPILCGSAQELLNAYDGSAPACIILDVRMPHMSGPKLQQELNRIAPHAVIIFVSAHGDIPLSVSALRAGATDFLEKPYNPQELLERVQSSIPLACERFNGHALRKDVTDRIGVLTHREREILSLVIEGIPSKNIARKLGLSTKTVDVHRARITHKTGSATIQTLIRDILRANLESAVYPLAS